MLLPSAALCLLAFALYLTMWRATRVRRLVKEAGRRVSIGDVETSVPEVLWHLRSLGGGPSTMALPKRATTSNALAAAVEEHLGMLTPEQRSKLKERSIRRERVAYERALTGAQLNVLPQAAAVGAVDGVLIGVSGQYEAIAASVAEALSAVEVTDLSSLVGTIVAAAPKASMPDFISDWVEQTAGEAAAAVLTSDTAAAVAAGAGEGLESLAGALDAGIPFASVGVAMHRAVRQKQAGLDDDRVRENFALDAGVRGSSVAIGAAAGTAIFPVVGTIIGGMLGGLFGGEVARAAKERHVRRAHEDLLRSVDTLGNEVMRSSWVTLAGESEEELQEKTDAHADLSTELSAGSRWRRAFPDLAYVASRLAVEVGEADLRLSAEEHESFKAVLHETGSSEDAWRRGAMLVARPDIAKRFDVKEAAVQAATAALADLGEERRKLALA